LFSTAISAVKEQAFQSELEHLIGPLPCIYIRVDVHDLHFGGDSDIPENEVEAEVDLLRD
jgi:hypothetical protein